jgi:hypothetical protein
LPSDQRQRVRRPLGQRPPFLFAWAEDVWEVSSGKIVPSILRYQVRDGMNGTGVITDQSGRVIGVDPSLLRANLHAWGKHEIPHEVDGALDGILVLGRDVTDVVEQRARFEADMDEKLQVYGATWPIDEDFLQAMAAGMPACAGIALGVDRLCMLMAGADVIEDVLWAAVKI